MTEQKLSFQTPKEFFAPYETGFSLLEEILSIETARIKKAGITDDSIWLKLTARASVYGAIEHIFTDIITQEEDETRRAYIQDKVKDIDTICRQNPWYVTPVQIAAKVGFEIFGENFGKMLLDKMEVK